MSLDQGTLSEVWSQAIVVPILSTPDVQILATTGLFHLPVYAPKYWSIFCTQVYLSTYVQSYDMLCDAQLGFHPNRSCDTQLITTVNDC